MEVRVYYEDTDCGGVVYYASYLRYFERARTELLRSVDIDIGNLAEKGILFIVSRAEIDYLFPARYGEILRIESTVSQIKNASFIITYQVINRSDSRLLSRGMTKMASVNENYKPKKFDKEIKNNLLKLSPD